MARGRPTLYQPEFCEQVIELGKQGKSLAQTASVLGVTRKCVYEWMERHPEFGDAIAHAREHSLAWWEDIGNAAACGQLAGANAHIWSRSMAARFPSDYTETSKVEWEGRIDIGRMSVPELLAELESYAAVLGLNRAPLTIDLEALQYGGSNGSDGAAD